MKLNLSKHLRVAERAVQTGRSDLLEACVKSVASNLRESEGMGRCSLLLFALRARRPHLLPEIARYSHPAELMTAARPAIENQQVEGLGGIAPHLKGEPAAAVFLEAVYCHDLKSMEILHSSVQWEKDGCRILSSALWNTSDLQSFKPVLDQIAPHLHHEGYRGLLLIASTTVRNRHLEEACALLDYLPSSATLNQEALTSLWCSILQGGENVYQRVKTHFRAPHHQQVNVWKVLEGLMPKPRSRAQQMRPLTDVQMLDWCAQNDKAFMLQWLIRHVPIEDLLQASIRCRLPASCAWMKSLSPYLERQHLHDQLAEPIAVRNPRRM